MFKISYLISIFLPLIIIYFLVKNRNSIGKYLQVLDHPNKDKIHVLTTPLIGAFGLVLFSIIIIFLLPVNYFDDVVITIFIYSYIFFLVGYIDDRVNLNAYLKLLISIIILIIAIYFNEIFVLKRIYVEVLNKYFFLDKTAIIFSILCILLLINSLNLIDGINGLASGFSTLWLICLSFLVTENTRILLLFLSFFMIINTYQIIKGKYFLGDSGTLFLGSLISLMTIFTYNTLLSQNIILSIEKIFIFFMITGIDMFRLFISRAFNKKDPFKKDLIHLHHLIIKQFSLHQALTIYLFLFILTNFFSFFDIINPMIIILIYIIIYIFYVFLSKKVLENLNIKK